MQLRLDAIRSNLDAILVHSRCNLDAVKISVKIESTDKVKSYFSGRVGWVVGEVKSKTISAAN